MSFDPEPYAAGIRAENDKERLRIRERLVRARAEAERLARAIKAKDSTVNRVFLFGSVARERPFREDFDIDLALEGGDLSSALDITEGSSFEVDLVRLELLPVAMRDRILREGIELGKGIGIDE